MPAVDSSPKKLNFYESLWIIYQRNPAVLYQNKLTYKINLTIGITTFAPQKFKA